MTDTVWVIMGNDFPEAVCSTEALAEIYIDDRKREWKANQYPPGPHRQIYWRAYPFQVRQA